MEFRGFILRRTRGLSATTCYVTLPSSSLHPQSFTHILLFPSVQAAQFFPQHVNRIMATAVEVRRRILLAQGMQLTSTHREWVAKCLGQITESNRSEVQAELKQVISEAFAAKTLWSTDWSGTQLQRLLLFPIDPPSGIST